MILQGFLPQAVAYLDQLPRVGKPAAFWPDILEAKHFFPVHAQAFNIFLLAIHLNYNSYVAK